MRAVRSPRTDSAPWDDPPSVNHAGEQRARAPAAAGSCRLDGSAHSGLCTGPAPPGRGHSGFPAAPRADVWPAPLRRGHPASFSLREPPLAHKHGTVHPAEEKQKPVCWGRLCRAGRRRLVLLPAGLGRQTRRGLQSRTFISQGSGDGNPSSRCQQNWFLVKAHLLASSRPVAPRPHVVGRGSPGTSLPPYRMLTPSRAPPSRPYPTWSPPNPTTWWAGGVGAST